MGGVMKPPANTTGCEIVTGARLFGSKMFMIPTVTKFRFCTLVIVYLSAAAPVVEKIENNVQIAKEKCEVQYTHRRWKH